MTRQIREKAVLHLSGASLGCWAAILLSLLAPIMAADTTSHSVPLTIVLQPAPANSAQRVPYVDITVICTIPADAGHPILKMALVTDNVVTVANTIESLTIVDTTGPVPVTVKDDPEGGEVTYRHWIASRSSHGALTVRYRVPISNMAATRGPAPPLELRSDSGTFSGAGETFLLLPEVETPQVAFGPIHIRWNLSRMATGALGVSSLGVGDVTLSGAKDLQMLQSCYFMAGKVKLYPQNPAATGFFAAWHGTAPFSVRDLMLSEERVYAYYTGFFKRPPTAPYGVFMRENPVNAGGGVELSGSFVATFGPKTDLDDLKITLAHEMLHTFVGSLDKPEGLLSSWYSEGMAVYYARLLALRSGQITPDQFLHDLNTTAARYYTDALIAAPNNEIPARFWSDTRIRVLPYDRGSMYFAVVDSETRAASGGKRSLDNLLLAMLQRREQHLPVDEDAWIEQVAKALADKGRKEFEAMLSGAVQVPGPDAFGPCFTRTTKMLRRYQLGFDPKVLTEPRRIIRGLIPGSSAELAGIRNGDEITQPVPQDAIQGDQNALLTLNLLRDGKPLQIGYLPRGVAIRSRLLP